MELRCPNCSQLVESTPIRCPRCGYRSEMAREYFWIYLTGTALIALGFGLGIVSLLVHNSPADHWSAVFRDSFPFCAWSHKYHWIGFLAAGIVWTLAGMGVTRHRWDAWGLASAAVCWELGRSLTRLSTITFPEIVLLVAEFFIVATLLRVFLAFKKTPARDVRALQAKEAKEAVK